MCAIAYLYPPKIRLAHFLWPTKSIGSINLPSFVYRSILFNFFPSLLQDLFYRVFGFPEQKLQGELALVTGGGGGLGRLISLRLSKLGVDIVIWDIKQEGTITNTNTHTNPFLFYVLHFPYQSSYAFFHCIFRFYSYVFLKLERQFSFYICSHAILVKF